MDPGLALAINSCVDETASIIAKFVKKLNEIRVFKRKCERLGKEIAIFHQLLDSKREAIKTLQTLREFEACVIKAEEFANKCALWNIVDISLEVFVRNEYPGLMKRLYGLREVFVLDSVTEILKREGAAHKVIKENQNKLDLLIESQRTQTEVMAELQLKLSQREIKVQRRFGSSSLDKIEVDLVRGEDLTVSFDAAEPHHGHGNLQGVGSVTCYPVVSSIIAKENLDIYQGLQEGAYVQRFYGTMIEADALYAVMEDCRDEITLNKACREGLLPDSLLDRVELATSLAKSVAWFHRADVVLKSINDNTVVLKRLPSGKIYPFLTNLEKLRTIHEKTSHLDYDIRYEAPEYFVRGQHELATDVWSLGIVMWQCISGGFPYSTESEIYKASAECEEIRVKLRNGVLPGEPAGYKEARGLTAIIRQCWKFDAMQRTTADVAAKELYGITASLAAPSPGRDLSATESHLSPDLEPEDNEEIIKSALEIIKAAREINKEKKVVVDPPTKIKESDFTTLAIEDNGSQPVISFILGAALWWKIADYSWLKGEEDSVVFLGPLSADGKRAVLALKYLHEAVSSCNTSAFLELYKAHSFLAREYRDKIL